MARARESGTRGASVGEAVKEGHVGSEMFTLKRVAQCKEGLEAGALAGGGGAVVGHVEWFPFLACDLLWPYIPRNPGCPESRARRDLHAIAKCTTTDSRSTCSTQCTWWHSVYFVHTCRLHEIIS